MNRRFDLYVMGWIAGLVACFLLVPVVAALILHEPVLPYVGSAGVAGAVAVILVFAFRTEDRRMRPRDGFLVVSGGWVLVSLLATLPYLLTDTLGPVDAIFEATSGFTTTGSTVIADVTVLPRALLLWRAMTQWIGGMGIILFSIAILPLLGIGGMQLFQAEVPGPVKDKVQPRLASTARTLWGIYVGLTAAEWIALRFCGVGGYEALCHAFTTLATGGFSTRNTSVGELGSPAAEWVITFFMLCAGINFVLHYRLLTGRLRSVLRDAELRYFLGVVAVATAVVCVTLVEPGAAFLDVLRRALFQVVSIVTTTGYVTEDFEVWHSLALVVILVLMVLGGMSGSTGGGAKSLRILIAVRSLRATIHRLIHPHALKPVKYGDEVVEDSVLSQIWGFLTAYVLLATFAAAIIAAHDYDVLTSISAALTALGNVGPGLGEIGAYDNFSHFPALPKLVMSGCMLLGRLEIFTILALLSREFWRR